MIVFGGDCQRRGGTSKILIVYMQLGGGFKYVVFSPLFGEDSHFDSYFSKGLVQPPTRQYDYSLVFQAQQASPGGNSEA